MDNYTRGKFGGGAFAVPMVSGFFLAVHPTSARADSHCSVIASSSAFSCSDEATSSTFSIAGNIPAGAELDVTRDGLSYRAYPWPDLDLVASGSIRTSDQYEYPVFISTGGNMTYDGSAQSITAGGGSNVGLRLRAGDQMEVWTGNVTSMGPWAYGVFVDAGQVVVHGGETVVGYGSKGIYAQSNYGDVTVFTGDIDASQPESTGVVAYTKDWGLVTPCGAATVNVDGNVVGGEFGVRTISCKGSTVNVLPGGDLKTGDGGVAIKVEARTWANVAIDGIVSAAAPSSIAVDLHAMNSNLVVGSGGSLVGRYYGTVGFDTFQIERGGTWSTHDENNFGGGTDVFRNNGIFSAGGDTRLLGLESFANYGVTELRGASLSLPSAKLTNFGTIVTGGVSTMSAQKLLNYGTIDMRNGALGDRLTITGNLSSGAGSKLLVDVSSSGADLLEISGTASGNLKLQANLLPGASQIISPTLVVMAPTLAKGASVTLGGVSGDVSPLVSYDLSRNGAGYYLSSRLSALAMQPAVMVEAEKLRWNSMLSQDSPMASAGVLGGMHFGRELSDHRWSFDAVTRYFSGSANSRQAMSALSGMDLRGSVRWDQGSDGWHAAATVGALMFKTRLPDFALNGLDATPTTTEVGAAVMVGRRQGIGNSKIDWQASLSARHINGTTFTADDVHYSMPDLTRVEASLGVKWHLPGKLQPMLEASVNAASGGAPLTAELEGKRFDIAHRRLEAWLHLGASMGQATDRGISFSVSSDVGARTAANLVATYRF